MSADTSFGEELNSQNVDAAELIVELYSEEIPWRMQEPMAQNLTKLLQAELLRALGFHKEAVQARSSQEKNWEEPFGKSQLYWTPRRVAVAFYSVPKKSKAWREEIKGPRVASPQTALEGFLRKNNLNSEKECSIKKDADKGDYYALEIEHRPVATSELLGEVVSAVVRQMQKELKVSMRFASQSFRWVRPLRRILVVFDGCRVKGSIGLGSELCNERDNGRGEQEKLDFTNETRAATLTSAKPFAVTGIKDYESKLRDNYVEPIYQKRLEMIKKDVGSVDNSQNIIIEENASLTEYPCVLKGYFDEEFLSLPLPLIQAVLNHHQKIIYNAGSIEKKVEFYFVANISQATDKDKVSGGVERVVRARLADAKFMLERDKKIPNSEHIKRLEHITFHPKLGSIADKNSRVKKLMPIIFDEIQKHNNNINISKKYNSAFAEKEVDKNTMSLATETVREFPKLQSIINNSLEPQEHYDDDESYHARITNLADTIDSLVSLWLAGERASGSGDPFFLRRYAFSVINIVTFNNNLKYSYYLPLSIIFAEAKKNIYNQAASISENIDELSGLDNPPEPIRFMLTRLHQWLIHNHKKIRVDCIEAILTEVSIVENCNILEMLERIKILNGEMDKNNHLAEIFRRLQAMLSSDLKLGFLVLDPNAEVKKLPEPELFEKPEEKALFAVAEDIIVEGSAWSQLSYQQKLESLAELKSPLDAFFDKVMVNVEDKKIRDNRVILLYRIFRRFGELANFDKIHHKDLVQKSRQKSP